MEYCLEILKRKIDDYLNGIIDKEKLGKWGKEAYYDLLRGGYTKKEKIIIYPFLKTVSQIGLEIDEMSDIYPSTKEEIEVIQSIIMGIKPYNFQIIVTVPKYIYKNYENYLLNIENLKKFERLKKELENYLQNMNINSKLFEYVKEITTAYNSNETILDMLQEQIVRSCNALFDIEQQKLMPQLGLYPKKSYNNLGLLKLKEYLECIVGEKNFIINVSYIKGENSLSILV